MTLGEVNPFVSWFSQWGQVVFFFAQIAFWVLIAGAAIAIAVSYRRYVDHVTGAAQVRAAKKEGNPAPPASSAPQPSGTAIDVEKFVD